MSYVNVGLSVRIEIGNAPDFVGGIGERQVLLKVTDTGRGMDDEVRTMLVNERGLTLAEILVAVAIIAALFLRVQTPDQNYDSRTETISLIESQDSELIADLDDLIESDDNNSWDESVLL